MYGAAEGGSYNIAAIDFSQDVAEPNQQNLQSVVIGHSSSNTGTFNPGGALYPIIGGIGVTSSPVQTFTFSNNGVGSISGTFTLNQDSLVVLVAASSQNNAPATLSSSFAIDQQMTNTNCNFGVGCGSVVLAQGSFSSGLQSFSLTLVSSYGRYDPTSAAIGVVLYAFSTSPTTTLSVSNLSFPGGTFISLTDPFQSFSAARTFAYDAATSGVAAQNNPPFGTVQFSLDVTNTGTAVANNVVVNVVFVYPLTYSVCLEVAVACTSSFTEQITQSEPTLVGTIQPGQTVTVNGLYTIQYASVMALVEAVTQTNVAFISLPGFASGAQDYATAQGSNTGSAVFGSFPTLSGMNYGEVSYNTILGVASSYAGQTIAAYLDYGAASLGNFLGFDTSFITQAGVMIEGGTNEFKNFYNVVSTVGSTIITAISNSDPPTFTLVAKSPTGQLYQATSNQGVAQLFIQNPSVGNWEVDITGTNVAPGGAPFILSVALGAGPSTTVCSSGVTVTSGGNSNLQGANLAGCNLADYNLAGDNLKNAILSGADVQGVSFQGSNLLGANLEGANTLGTNFQGANLMGANLLGDNLAADSLQGANLKGANLQSAILTGASFAGANLQDANLASTTLTGLSSTQLTNFNGANMQNVVLTSAVCGNPDYITASGTNLQNAQNVPADCVPPL